MTQLNWLNISHCVAGSGGLQWLKYFTRICLHTRTTCIQEAARIKPWKRERRKTSRYLWERSAASIAESTAVHPLVTRRREQWRRRKLIILQVPRLLDGAGAAGKEEARKRERKFLLWRNADERALGGVVGDVSENHAADDTGGLLLASWFCRAQFCSRTTAKTRRTVMLEIHFCRCSRYLNKINVHAKEFIFDGKRTRGYTLWIIIILY